MHDVRKFIVATLLAVLVGGCSPADKVTEVNGTATYVTFGQPMQVDIAIDGVAVKNPVRWAALPDGEFRTTGPARVGQRLGLSVESLPSDPYGVIECRIEAFGRVAEATGRNGSCYVGLTP